MEKYDLLIIGGGPGGYSVGIAAAKKGMKVALFEKSRLGGTCLNIGCIPTKYLVDKANALEKIRALVRGDVIRDAGSFSFRQIQQGKEEVVDKLVGGVEFLLKKYGVTVLCGEAVLKKDRIVVLNGKEYAGKYVVIATGSQPSMPPIPGCEHCIDSTGALGLTSLPRSMAVIGGGVIGLELACAFAAYGTDVTVLEMMPELLPREQREAAQIVVRQIGKLGIVLRTSAKILGVERDGGARRVIYEQDGKKETVTCEQVLMAAGRRTNLSGIDAAALGLELDGKNQIVVDSHQRTNLAGIYAVGDVVGGYQLAHAAYAEGEAALADILGEDMPYGASPIPVCTYTIPCLASVGLTTEGAKDAGYEPVMGVFDYSANGMALAEGAAGRVFVIADKATTQTLGVTIVGENAPEMIAFAADAVANKTTLEQWKQMVVAHPSLCEMVREAALDAFGAAVHKA